EAGAAVLDVQPGELPFEYKKAIKIENQSRFNPVRYTQQLALAIADASCRIFENTRVTSMHEEEDNILIKTEKGDLYARYAVHATHTQKGLVPDFHSLLGTYRDYGIAARMNSENYLEGIFLGFFNLNDRYLVRSYERDGNHYIIVVGQPHQVGQ